MPNYTCEKCGQDFNQKNDYTRHINKKYPCITQDKLKEFNDIDFKELKEKISENDSLKYLESFFLKLREIIRDLENITGDKALDVITDFLFLRLLNYELENNKDLDNRIKHCADIYETSTVVLEVIPNFEEKTSDFLIVKDRFGLAGQRIACAFDKGRYINISEEAMQKLRNEKISDLKNLIDGEKSQEVDE